MAAEAWERRGLGSVREVGVSCSGSGLGLVRDLLRVAKVVSWLIEGLSGKSGLPLSALGSLLMRGSIG
jgi:hypothetical protein